MIISMSFFLFIHASDDVFMLLFFFLFFWSARVFSSFVHMLGHVAYHWYISFMSCISWSQFNKFGRFVQFGADQDCHCGALGCRQKLGVKPSKPKVLSSDAALKIVACQVAALSPKVKAILSRKDVCITAFWLMMYIAVFWLILMSMTHGIWWLLSVCISYLIYWC